jgi:hypothetical protein
VGFAGLIFDGELFWGLATGIRHQVPSGQSGRTPSGKIGASTRSSRNIEISVNIPT